MIKLKTSDRIKEIMRIKGYKQIDIVRRAKPYCIKYGVKLERNDLSQYIADKVIPGQRKLTILAKALDVSETWLMGYDVSMDKNVSSSDNYSDIDNLLISKVKDLADEDKKVVLGVIDAIKKDK